MRILQGEGTIGPFGRRQAKGIVVCGVNMKVLNSSFLQVLNQSFKFSEKTHFLTALRCQRPLGLAILDENSPATILADNPCATLHAGCSELHQGCVIDNFGRHISPHIKKINY